MGKYRYRQPETVEAAQWPYHEGPVLYRCKPNPEAPFCERCGKPMTEHACAPDGDTTLRVCPGQWVVEGDGGYYVMGDEEFEHTFEPAEGE